MGSELIPTEVESARSNGRLYERASALLARIRAEVVQPTIDTAPINGGPELLREGETVEQDANTSRGQPRLEELTTPYSGRSVMTTHNIRRG